MRELTRFRIVRAPVDKEAAEDRVLRYPEPRDHTKLEFAPPPPPPLTHVPTTPRPLVIRNAAQVLVHPRARRLPTTELAQLRQLHQWLEARAFQFSAEEFLERLAPWAHKPAGDAPAAADAARLLTTGPAWAPLRVAVGDSILIQLTTHESPQDLQILCSWFLVIGFIERVAGLTRTEVDALDRRRWLLDRVLLLPRIFFRPTTTLVGSGAMLARQPAFADMVVIREEWSCYQPSEIAHIENVLRGENKTRTHVRTDETTVSVSEEVDRTKIDERDTQSSDRTSLQEEVSRQAELSIGVQGQVDISANYGPVQIETSFGANVSYSTQESQRRANEVSREVVNRSLNRIEEHIASKRATVTLNRVVETNSHVIDNSVSPSGHVVGIYRWVDKISRLQVVRYPHRFVLEFQIPEPAAYVRWLQRQAPPLPVNIPAPPDFTDLHGQPLDPSLITRENYMKLVAKFRAAAQTPPPEDTVHVSSGADVKLDDALPDSQDSRIEFAPTAAAQIDLVVPAGYSVIRALASFAATPLLAKWRDQEVQDHDGDPDEIYYTDTLGYHEIVAGITFGGVERVVPVASAADLTAPTVNRARNRPSGGKPWGYGHRESWFERSTDINLPAGVGSGQMKANIIITGTPRCIVSVDLTCRLTPAAFQEWQLETFDRLREAHTSWDRRYKDAVSAKEIQRGIEIPGRSPEANRVLVRDELKRQVIEMLLGHRFDGLDLVDVPAPTSTSTTGPTTRLEAATANAPIVQFVEQVFEWSNLTYILYPYYWTTRERWPELMPVEGADPAYVEFLRSGSARVVVPARPGFESDVLAFMSHGMPWSGGPVPLADDDDRYISVAQEIQDQRGAPEAGEAGDLWEVRQPTTLVWLDSDSQLPKHNERRRLVGTPLIDLCATPES